MKLIEFGSIKFLALKLAVFVLRVVIRDFFSPRNLIPPFFPHEAVTAHAFLYSPFLKCACHSVDIAAAWTVVWQLTAALVSRQVPLAARYEQQLIETPSSEGSSLRYFCRFITECTELLQVFLKLNAFAKCFGNMSVYLVFQTFYHLRLILVEDMPLCFSNSIN